MRTEHARETDASGLAAWIRLALALGVTLAVLWPSVHGALVYDDLWLVAQNPAIRSLATLPEALTGAYWDFIDPDAAARIGYWRPLTSVALHVGFRLGDGAPWGFHAVSLALHLGATALAFLLALRLTADRDAALFAGLLFGVHPVHVESAAWISAVNDPLHGLACLAAMLAFLSWRERGSPGLPVAAPALFLAALLAKENAAALVPLLLALDFGRRRGDAPARARDRLRPFARAWLPFAAVLLVYAGLRVAVFGEAAAGFDRVTTVLNVSALREWSLRVEMLGGYLGLLVWPAELNLFREVRAALEPGTFWPALGWIALWTVALVVLLRRPGERARPALAALLFLPAGVLPALVRISAIGRFPLSERFLYLSVLGIALLAALAALRFLPRPAAVVALALLASGAAWQSRARLPFWADELSLFAASAQQNPDSAYVQWSLGRVLLEEFKRTGEFAVLDEAQRAFLRAQDLYSQAGPADFVTREDLYQANLGNGWFYLFGALGNHRECTFEEAELVFGAILGTRPDSVEALTGRAVARMYQGELAEAEADLERASGLDAKDFGAWYWLGSARLRAGRPADAVAALERAVALRPDDREATLLLAAALAEGGDGNAARLLLGDANERWPDDAQVMLALGRVAAREGRAGSARTWFERALAVDGNLGPAHLERGKLLLAEEDPAALPDAVAALDRASRLMPRSFEAFYSLGVALLKLGAPADALPRLVRALELDPENVHADALRAEIERLRAELGR